MTFAQFERALDALIDEAVVAGVDLDDLAGSLGLRVSSLEEQAAGDD
jgi:hypothetical protein